MERVLGIDLGTSNSCVAVVDNENAVVIADQEGRRTQPSVVSFFPDGKQIAGWEAREQLIYNPRNTVYSAKRLIGRPYNSQEVTTFKQFAPYSIVEGPNASVLIEAFDQQYSVPEISAIVLMHMKKIAEDYLQETVKKAVVTVPANFNDAQRNATKQAGELAGLDVLKVINEPTAAALAYGFGQAFDQRIAIYDFGGGTFDITVLEIQDEVFEVIATAGDTFLGGDDIDNLIVKMVVNSYRKHYDIDLRTDPIALLRIRYEAERAKRKLSTEEKTTISIPSLINTSKGMVDLNVALSRPNFNSIAGDVVKKSFVICDEAIKLAQIHATDVENVVLVGGTTHIPLVREMVEGYFGKKPYWGVNADEVVALGAAIQGSILAGSGYDEEEDDGDFEGQASFSPDAILLDVTSLSLGIATVGGHIEKIIKRNTPIPTERTRIFTTSRDYQSSVRIRVYQGEADKETENELIGVLELSGLDETALRGELEIEVAFEIDANGIVQVAATDTTSGQEAKAKIDLRGVLPSEPESDGDDDRPDVKE